MSATSPRLIGTSAVAIAALLAGSVPASARTPNLARYPLRVHVLAADRTDRVERMRPEQSLVCDSIEDVGTALASAPGTPLTISGVSSDPCSFGAGLITGRLLDLQAQWSYTGEGRADLVSPPNRTQGISFRYTDCGRIRVFPGFASLPARWKKPGLTLEVLVPSDDIPSSGHSVQPHKCTLSVNVHDFVYLLLANHSIVEVAEPDYWRHPALRVFLNGIPETMQQRVREFTVSAHPAKD